MCTFILKELFKELKKKEEQQCTKDNKMCQRGRREKKSQVNNYLLRV